MQKFKLWTIGLFVVISILVVPAISEAAFNKNNIMTDEYLHTTDTMSVEQIQNFLDDQPGVLKNYKVDGKSAAQIFYESSEKNNIRAEVLIALTEKEQGLLHNRNPGEKALAWATGFGSFGNSRYTGFKNQIDFAGQVLGNDYEQYSNYYNNFQVGKTTATLDGYKVRPENIATCNHYHYNPLVGSPNARFGANWLLWHILNVSYKDDFAKYTGNGSVAGAQTKTPALSSSEFFYRDGSVVRLAGDNRAFLIQKGVKHEFTGSNALYSRYHRSEIVTIDRAEFDAYAYGASIGLQDGLAVQRQKGGAVYIVSDGILRGVPDLEILSELGYSTADIVKITDKEANHHQIGAELTGEEMLNGQLVSIAGETAVYQFKQNQLLPIWSHKIKNANFEYLPAKQISAKDAEQYSVASQAPVQFRGGILVSATEGPQAGAVYIIANGKRYGFVSREALDSRGYDAQNVVRVPRSIMDLHAEGEKLE
ncbi:hypothetical protein ACFL2B_01790 [Patescibacteria group bacterium]